MPSIVRVQTWCWLFHRHVIIGTGLYSDCRFCGRRYVRPKPTFEEFRAIQRMVASG